jgi:heme oxygenase
LKHRTAGTHERVEATLGLLDPQLSAARLRDVLSRFAGFWQGTERVIDEWAERAPVPAEHLRWTRRRRREVLRNDLLRLGLTVRDLNELPEAPSVFIAPDTSEVLGWLYVSEGSTLGGAVIDRTLRALPEGAALRLRTFAPYLEGPGPMWRDYLAYLCAWVGDDGLRADQVVAAAEHTFDSLERWLTPLSSEDAA